MIQGGANGSSATVDSKYTPLFALPRWLKVVLCDIGGAITGIPGHLVGIICGAIGGSITGYATT